MNTLQLTDNQLALFLETLDYRRRKLVEQAWMHGNRSEQWAQDDAKQCTRLANACSLLAHIVIAQTGHPATPAPPTPEESQEGASQELPA